MAEKKTTKKTTKKNTAVYNGQKYTILDEAEGKLMLTDGSIHFWVKADKVER